MKTSGGLHGCRWHDSHAIQVGPVAILAHGPRAFALADRSRCVAASLRQLPHCGMVDAAAAANEHDDVISDAPASGSEGQIISDGCATPPQQGPGPGHKRRRLNNMYADLGPNVSVALIASTCDDAPWRRSFSSASGKKLLSEAASAASVSIDLHPAAGSCEFLGMACMSAWSFSFPGDALEAHAAFMVGALRHGRQYSEARGHVHYPVQAVAVASPGLHLPPGHQHVLQLSAGGAESCLQFCSVLLQLSCSSITDV